MCANFEYFYQQEQIEKCVHGGKRILPLWKMRIKIFMECGKKLKNWKYGEKSS